MFSSAFVCLFVSEIIQKLLSCTLQFNGHFPDESGLAGCPLILLHLFLKCASFWDRPKLSMSSLTQSHQVFFGHPVCLINSTSIIQYLTQSLSSLCSTCPNHLNLLSRRKGSNAPSLFWSLSG